MDTKKLTAALALRAPGCFLCKYILEDLRRNGEFTDYPKNANLEKPLFPAAAKVWHLKLEGIPLDS